jgi:hypothetical protein
MSTYTTFINFSTIDYTGTNGLSTFATNLTPLRFIPELSNSFNHRVIWEFGDGTISKSFSASKAYTFPGKYEVRLIVYDCNNNAMVSNVTKTILVYDYIPYTFNLNVINILDSNIDIIVSEDDEIIISENGIPMLSEGAYPLLFEDGSLMLTEDGDYVMYDDGTVVSVIDYNLRLKCGKIEGPFIANSYYPAYQPVTPLFYSISGSNSLNYWDIKDSKFHHLENFHSLYEKIYNYSIKSDQFSPIYKIEFAPTELYAKLVGNSITLCDKSDIGAVFVGLSASKEFYIKDDSISNTILLDFWFDKTKNVFQSNNFQTFNNFGITLSCLVVDNIASSLSITSNGLDGEGYTIDSFKINPIKYFNSKIPFIIKIKDIDGFSIKNFDTINLSSLNITLTHTADIQLATENGEYLLDSSGQEMYATTEHYILSSVYYTISSLNYTLSSQNSGGAVRGYIEFPFIDAKILQNVKILASGTFINDQSVGFTLSGESGYFNVYSNNYHDIWKINEDFNPSETLKELRFQETMLDKNVLFNDFFGGVLGDEKSNHESLGIKIYEKISNFVKNTQDIDNCEQEFIDSLATFVKYNDVGEERYNYPETIKRIINLASIDSTKLIGELNKFSENLDIKGRTSKDEFGINIGDTIDPFTYIVNKDTPIVALEKFSNDYVVLNTHQPLIVTGSDNYPLSSYTSDWGWPLVLPSSFDFLDIDKYYIFFTYNDVFDNTPIGGVIDFDNLKTTISRDITQSELIGDYGIFENMFLYTMYHSLSLIK